MIVWLTEEPLRLGAPLWLRGAMGYVPATVTAIRYVVDVNTLDRQPVTELALNQIARVTVECTRPVPVDAYGVNRIMGSFVLVDRTTHATAAAGMIRAVQQQPEPVHPIADASTSRVSSDERARLLGHPAKVLWITGLPCAGKGPLASALERTCLDRGILATVLRGSALRRGISHGLGFGPADREEQVRRLALVAALLADAGLVVVVTAVSPTREGRSAARDLIGAERFIEIHASADAAWCQAHDATGIWAAAAAGTVHGVPGHDADYEPPLAPTAVFAAGDDPAVAAAALVARLLGR
jgi:bifunctional enzyme CysN/CysC